MILSRAGDCDRPWPREVGVGESQRGNVAYWGCHPPPRRGCVRGAAPGRDDGRLGHMNKSIQSATNFSAVESHGMLPVENLGYKYVLSIVNLNYFLSNAEKKFEIDRR